MLEKILPWSREKKFWKWFVKYSDELFNFEVDQQRIFDELAGQLKKVHESLTFEFGPIQDNKREFIVSADGISSAFPYVQKLVAISPKMDRWSIIPFRPPKGPMNSIQFEDYILYPEDVWFKHEKDGGRTGLVIYIRNFSEDNEIKAKSAVFIMLDSALGEYNVETMVGFIEFMPLADRPDALGLLPFETINDIFNLNFQ